jgi:hypothetical protein
MRDRLAGVTVHEAFAHTRIVDREMAACCLSGLWLLHDFLDDAHAICQNIDTASGSLWHAIMHRREGDFSNSKYWLRRAGPHDVFGLLGRRAGELAAARGASSAIATLTTGGQWEPFAFVDLVEAVERGRRPDARELCLDIQQEKWELFFDWCFWEAVR